MENEVTSELLSEYYEKKFPVESFMSYLGLSDFPNREFGFVINDRFTRNISFANTKKLKEFMVTNSVEHAYVGSVYGKPPSRENRIHSIEWKYREFIFDIDINEYDLVRTCDCGKYDYCRICWPLVQDAVLFIEETMKEDFGFKEMKWFFSGRRGVHGWVMDKDSKGLNNEQRVSILNYLTFIHDETRSQSIEEIPNEAKPLRNRIFSLLVKPYIEHSFIVDLDNPILQCKGCNSKFRAFELIEEVTGRKAQGLRFEAIGNRIKTNNIKCKYCSGELENITKHEVEEFGLTELKARKIISQVKETKSFDHNQYNIIMPNDWRVRRKMSNDMVLHRYPRIDRAVSTDIKRVSRIPYSVHGNTGKLVMEIKDINSFYPDSAPNIWEALM